MCGASKVTTLQLLLQISRTQLWSRARRTRTRVSESTCKVCRRESQHTEEMDDGLSSPRRGQRLVVSSRRLKHQPIHHSVGQETASLAQRDTDTPHIDCWSLDAALCKDLRRHAAGVLRHLNGPLRHRCDVLNHWQHRHGRRRHDVHACRAGRTPPTTQALRSAHVLTRTWPHC